MSVCNAPSSERLISLKRDATAETLKSGEASESRCAGPPVPLAPNRADDGRHEADHVAGFLEAGVTR